MLHTSKNTHISWMNTKDICSRFYKHTQVLTIDVESFNIVTKQKAQDIPPSLPSTNNACHSGENTYLLDL